MIAHFDLDAFYASVAQRDDPSLRGKPIAISRHSARAVVLTASYEARPYGVRSAMPLYRALDACPDLVVVEPNGARYREVSAIVFSILSANAEAFESLSLDEAFLDFGECDIAEARTRAEDLRAEVHAAVQLTISAGVATSKLVAKIACDAAKPDGLLAVPPGEEAAFLAPMPIGRLHGIGPKSEPRLIAAGVATIGALADLDGTPLFELFGRSAEHYRMLARGIDDRVVTEHRERKSISSETTFERNVDDERSMLAVLREQAEELAETLQRKGLRAAVVGVKVKHPDFRVRGRQTHLTEPTSDMRLIFAAARFCLRDGGFNHASLRLIGTRVANLTADHTRQLPLW